MKKVRIWLNNCTVTEAGLADNYFLRLRGLIGRDPEQIGGLLIKPCSQIHTFFMSVPIDVVYLDRQGKVLAVDPSVPVSRCCKAVRGARMVLELPTGKAEKYGIIEGNSITYAV